MLEPIQQRIWPRPDRRAWGLGLTLLLLSFAFALCSFFLGRSWTYRTDLEYLPKEITIQAYNIDSDLMEFALGLPNYAMGAYYTLANVLPHAWIYPLSIGLFMLIVSLLAAGASYLNGTFHYGALAAFAVGVAFFGVETFAPLGVSSQWIAALVLFLVALPIYVVNHWFHTWNLARRWWVLLLYYTVLTAGLLYQNGSQAEMALGVAQLWFPLLLASLIFMVINATDVLQGVLTLVTKEENSRQSWIHFTIFSSLYLANFILIYLKNTGQLVLDIFYLNPFFLQGIAIVVGLWMLERKGEILADDTGRNTGFSTLYIALGSATLLAIGLAFATANDLMIEVLEDAVCLIHFCVGTAFFMYVAINYFQLMGLGLRVHLVMFKPRYMPLFAVPVFGLGGVLVFMLNVTYFPYYQALSAKEVLMADQARFAGDAFLAENYLKKAINLEYRNQRSNLSLAALYSENGNAAKAQEYAQASMDKFPCPEAYLAMSQVYRQKKMQMYELLQLQEGIKAFPDNGKLLNNMGMAFSETKLKDSTEYYLSRAAQSRDAETVGKANLGYYFLANRLEADGLPQKSPDQETTGSWSQLNNRLVFANIAHERSPALEDVVSGFGRAPESLKPFLLFHSYINKAINRDSTGFQEMKHLENDTIRKFYSEPLLMAKGMVYYRTGSTQKGLEMLTGLFRTSSTSRLDMALLLGQIYYEQGAYAMAADFFRQAANLGMDKARYWYALSCLDAGNAREAAESFRESLPYLGQADRVRISVLIDGLKSGQFHNAAQRSDPEKSAYIKVNWNRISDNQLKDLIYLIADKEAQRFLWHYAFQRAYGESMRERCAGLYQFGNQFFGKKAKWVAMLREARPMVFDITGDVKKLEAWVQTQKEIDAPPFFKGRLAQLTGNAEEALLQFTACLAVNPLNNRQVGLALTYLGNQPATKSLAYQKALEMSDLNPSNIELLKLYALLSVKEGVPEFGYQVLPKIELHSSKQTAEAFKARLDEAVKQKYGRPTNAF